MSDIESEQQTAGSTTRTKGRVKWFNNKAGYGFITEGTGDDSQDVFVHHSALKTTGEQYKYAVEGEYVEFVMSEADSDKHKWQATEVTGLNGGPLLCETRNARRDRLQDQGEEGEQQHRAPRHTSHRPRGNNYRSRGGRSVGPNGPRFMDSDDPDYEWTLVRRRKTASGGHQRRGHPAGRSDMNFETESGDETTQDLEF